jgi:hypothetical protein
MRCIRILIECSFCFRWVGVLFLPLVLLLPRAWAQTPVSILLTSNLQGKFSLDIENQDIADPLLLLAQNVISETDHGVDLYLDLGNAFYPGVLSKYSMGSVMMDFLDYFSCAAVLVSSKDLQIGTNNLEFLQTNKSVRLLSANIGKETGPIFTPWFEIERQGLRMAILGISSSKIEFDIAEKNLFGYSLIDHQDALATPLAEIKEAGIDHVVLLSGMNLKDTAEMVKANPQIGIALCGGDYTGHFFSTQASRMDLDDGRSVVIVNDTADYFRLELIIDKKIEIASFAPQEARPIPTDDFFYSSFKNRLTLWKEKFIEDETQLIANLNAAEFSVDDERFSQLLRDRFDCEVAIVEDNTINPSSVGHGLKPSDFLTMVNQDYFVFLFSLTGDELTKVNMQQEGLVITGLDSELVRVQGYPLVGNRPYRVAASQPAMRAIMHILRKPIAFTNTWMTVTDLLKEDLKNACIVLRDDYEYLDRRFRTTLDTYFSNFIDNSGVKKGDTIETPAGQSSKTYNKWGLEDKIDLTVYNQDHRFVFTPYMLYSRKDDDYLNNILRGTFLYEYNLHETIRPYNKFRCDTVVEEVDGLRPIVLRETLGISLLYDTFTGKLGIGFEKEVQDPAKAGLYGIELLAGLSVPFLSYFTYSLDLDAFSGFQNEEGSPWQIRSEINNAISAKINTFMSLAFRHKFFYFYEGAIDEYYQNSQFLVSLDLNKDWKFW